MSGPIIITNEPLATCGGIQRYVASIQQEFQSEFGDVRTIQPYSVRRPRSRIMELTRLFARYATAVRSSRPLFVVASVWYPSGFVAALIPKRFRGPLAILAHGSEVAPGRRGFRHILMRYTFARADAIFANSEYVRCLLRQAGVDGEITIAACGVGGMTSEAQKERRPTILSTGRLIERKGFDAMMIAMPEILKSIPDAMYVIVGEGPYGQKLKHLAKMLKIEDSVIMRGFLPDEVLVEAYASAHCFSMPARRIRDDVEGFGIVYLEAATAGLPTIGGKDSGARDAIEDGVTGFLVDGTDPSAIAKAAISLLNDPARASEMGARGRDRALHNFTWKLTADAIIKKVLEHS